ncbi:alpha/beta fold hydrolase [Piscinibacter koreensis]|uniref:Alpha/beta fold hydrolase n=1 Tax=Piscinibacter koreensis TaxID=2742824 RepID=A0A7Y6NK23_9BURK|nr:alpha/beta fold hydrolase [Schlegelella koreensis]NUZ04621.1 alpha/beta fold hydrolase [Schlegelella koreensis]
MQHIRASDGIRIAVDVHEGASGQPRLALIHSLAMDHAFWAPVVERLTAEAAIVAIDARGHGASDKPLGPYTAERMAADLADVLDALGWPAAVVAGASMGGCLALQFAADYPERTQGLGLVDTTAWYGPEAPKDWAARGERARSQGLASMIDFQRTRWFSDEFQSAHPEVVARCVETFVLNDVEAFDATCNMLGRFDGRASLAGIRVPTAVIVGEQDYAAPVAMAEALRDGIAGAQLTVIPGARHLTPLETPDVVVGELRRLLQMAA